ncbi:MAG: LysR family transcriptional regulator [Halobacteriovoraceae bacterium]|nr:LysR family transcriptional regulator [Halobacteriovoraceae bacterium]MCB9095553.1 LysR family transcriptional regulator [Halobacteriovoraceae bacterium]
MTISNMEINELKYFLAVAEVQNVNRAAINIAISPGSLSKAIAKLENELQVKLFERVGRNIQITPAGKSLQTKASQIINLEESARLEISGEIQEINVVICGEELLVAEYGVLLSNEILQLYPKSKIKLLSTHHKHSTQKIINGEAHIALTTSKPHKELNSKLIDKIQFSTCIGKKHPLYKSIKKNEKVPISTVLQYPFVLPNEYMLGKTKENQSADGWRDDKFPRIISYQASSIKILESLVLSGKAIAYLPNYFAQNLDVGILDIEGCPYFCEQKIYAVCRNPLELGWLNQIW